MLRECVEIFNKIYLEQGDKLITDSYELEQGDYFIVKKDGNFEHIKIEKDTTSSSVEKYDYLSQRDYYSKLLDMNKPIDGKKQIHSNNYLSFFIKNNVLGEKKDTLDEVIKKYYEILKNPLLKYDKGEKKRIYEELEKELEKPDIGKIEKNYNWIKENLYFLTEKTKESKNYLKIFFEEDLEEYKKENKRYVIPNIYNNTDYNVKIEDKTYGLPNNNLNLNTKKPYLENKTRKKNYTVPYLLDEENVFEQKKFFDYLQNLVNKGIRNVYITNGKIIPLRNNEILEKNLSGYFLRIRKDKSEAAIERFEVIPRYENEISFSIEIIDCLNDNVETKLEYGNIINTKKQLIGLLNSYLFKGKIFTIVYENIKDIKIIDSKIKYISNIYKDVFYKLIIKGEMEEFLKVYKIIFLEFIKHALSVQSYKTEAYNLYNIMSSIEGGKKLEVHEKIREKLRKSFENGKGIIENNDEYYFTIGQIIFYLLSRNKETEKKHDAINRILNFKDIKQLKEEIRKLFIKYNYDIKFQNKRFNLLYEMILGYIPENNKIDYDRLLGGYLSYSLIYEKNENN